MPRPVFKAENPKREPKEKKNILLDKSSASPASKANAEEEIILVPYVGIK